MAYTITMAKTENGWVRGYSSANQMNSVFKGIPYAAPPVGELRWKAPQPAKNWEGVFDAVRWPNRCTQAPKLQAPELKDEFFSIDTPMSEDCLYLNIWTPAISDEQRLPVAVYFHGGGMQSGYSYANMYDGDGFAKRGIVFVSVNYRLNIFGFFADPELRDEDPNGSTGCYGTLDQAFALKWVKRNIAAFGGDPEQVSIFGQSGGGRSVQTLGASQIGKGLFNRAIMQSGGGLSTGSNRLAASLEEGYEVCELLKKAWNVKNMAEAREIPADKLMSIYLETMGSRVGPKAIRYMGPKIDGYVLTAERSDMFRAGLHNDVQYMVGCTDSEFYNANAKVPPMEELEKAAAEDFGEYAGRYMEVLRSAPPEELEAFIKNEEGDTMKANAVAWCELQLDLKRRPSYAYLFKLVAPGNDVARHSSEHHYVFQTLMRTFRPYTGRDFDLSNELADRWANFFKYGDPNDEKYSNIWTPYTRAVPQAFIIDYDSKMGRIPESRFMEFIKDYSLGRL